MLLKEKNNYAACEPEKEKQDSLCSPREGKNLICPHLFKILPVPSSGPFLEHLHLTQWRTGTRVSVWR